MGDEAGANSHEMHKAQQRYKLPEGARQILLVRHGASMGETIETVQLGPLTITNPPLSPEGHAQAAALAEALKGEPIAHIFISPLQRTQQTAAPLVEATGLRPVMIEDLREVHMGDWEHTFYGHARSGHPLLQQLFVQETWSVIPNAEDPERFAARLRSAIGEIIEATRPGETSVAFSHAAVIADICRQATGSKPFAFLAPENTSVTRLIVDAAGNWRLRNFNDVSHLGYH
jgi:2,3-bisphosphoglycerate-dependent phosphoglycerate mutase